jgi:hypothetical protein
MMNGIDQKGGSLMKRMVALRQVRSSWRRLLVGGGGLVLAMALLFTTKGTARADQCFTQGYDYSGGWHDYYAYSYPCLGSAAPLYLYYGAYPLGLYGYSVPVYTVPLYQTYYQPYTWQNYNYQWYSWPYNWR